MSNWETPYVYLIFDTQTRKRYIGRSNGRPNYFSSGKHIRNIRKKRPDTLKRVKVFESLDINEVIAKEREYHQRRFNRGTWHLYYNHIVGDPANGADLAGVKNPNYKDGSLVGASRDPAIRKLTDKKRNAERHARDKEGNRARMKARYHLLAGNEQKAKTWFDIWQQYKKSLPPSKKGKYVRTFEVWEEWKGCQK